MKSIMQKALRLAARSLLALSLVFALSAFRHTEVETQKNPDFAGYTFDAVYVQIPTNNAYFNEYVVERLTREFKNSKIRIYTSDDLFSPFKSWTLEEKMAALDAHGIRTSLVISLASASSRVGNGVVFFDSDMGMATHMQSRSDRAVFHVRLIDLETSDLAWTAIVRTRASGTLFATDKSAAKAVSKHLARSLREAGYLLR